MRIMSLVRCGSADVLNGAVEFARAATAPDAEITKTVVSVPGGPEVLTARVGDYFDGVDVTVGESSFWLAFRVKAGVDSFWKDVAVAVLGSIEKACPGCSVLIHKGFSMTPEEQAEQEARKKKRKLEEEEAAKKKREESEPPPTAGYYAPPVADYRDEPGTASDDIDDSSFDADLGGGD